MWFVSGHVLPFPDRTYYLQAYDRVDIIYISGKYQRLVPNAVDRVGYFRARKGAEFISNKHTNSRLY